MFGKLFLLFSFSAAFIAVPWGELPPKFSWCVEVLFVSCNFGAENSPPYPKRRGGKHLSFRCAYVRACLYSWFELPRCLEQTNFLNTSTSTRSIWIRGLTTSLEGDWLHVFATCLSSV